MMRWSILFWLVVVAGAGGWLYNIKYKVIGLEDQIAAFDREMQADQDAIQILDAEWSHLNSPERLEDLIARHLEMEPVTAADMVTLASLPMADPNRAGPSLGNTTPGAGALSPDAPPLPVLMPERHRAPGSPDVPDTAPAPADEPGIDDLILADITRDPTAAPPPVDAPAPLVPAELALQPVQPKPAQDPITALISDVLTEPRAAIGTAAADANVTVDGAISAVAFQPGGAQ